MINKYTILRGKRKRKGVRFFFSNVLMKWGEKIDY